MAVKKMVNMRLPERCIALIEKQQGGTFTEKFVNFCILLDDQTAMKQQQLAFLDNQIKMKQERLETLHLTFGKLRKQILEVI